MSNRLRNIGIQLRALCAMLLLFAGSIAVPVKLMVPASVDCGMSCCEERGVCYCPFNAHSRSDDGTVSETSAEIEMGRLQISSSCPVHCAQVPAGFKKNSSFVKARTPECVPATNISQLIKSVAPHFALLDQSAESSSPRSPPSAFS